ncbi:MAG: hypothetical protein B6245_20545 [Desulfobacteraceae bacterium 4572_88]|nr:MAG: hypothetical protein B6245_20545 [Desulfobacteraceae bacterium 4572_88]
MNTYPTLYSERLMLRPFHLDDAPDIQRLAGDKEIALKTENIPHPYEKSHAEEWIRTHQEKFDKQEEISWAIAHREQSHLIGTIPSFSKGEKERQISPPLFLKGE